MPNVMGREFPYTPQGMAAAEQYKQAMGMRDGGMMGFRPVGYANGNLVESVGNPTQRGVSAAMGAPVDASNVVMAASGRTDSMAVVRELTDLEQSGTTQDVVAFISANQADLLEAARQNPQVANYLQRMIARFAPPQPGAAAPAAGGMGGAPYTGVPPEMRQHPDMAPPMAPPQAMPSGFQGMAGGGLMSLRRR